MTAPELKPCPFCGGEAITSPSFVDRQVLYAHCKDRTCPGWTVSRCPPVRWNRRADLAAVQPAQVRVKPLVWTQIGSSYRAPAPLFGHIRVEDYASGKWSVLWSAPGICDTFTAGAFYTPEAAKAAAQADYEARILAAIDVQPDPRDAQIAALVDAMHTISGDIQIDADGEEELSDAARIARAAIAAAKAVQHG